MYIKWYNTKAVLVGYHSQFPLASSFLKPTQLTLLHHSAICLRRMHVIRPKLLNAVGCLVGNLLLEDFFGEELPKVSLQVPVDVV